MKANLPLTILVLVLALLIGCQSNDARIADMAKQQAEREAEQSRQMSQLQQEVAEGSRRLVESDAQARQELAALQRELRTDQAEVGQQRDALETERRQIATERQWDSIIGPTITAAALLVACVLPLLLCFAVLRSLRTPEQTEEALSELLVHELVTDRPLVLPPPLSRAAIQPPAPSPEGDPQDSA